MSIECAGTTKLAGPPWRPTPIRSNVVAARDGRTPAPLNIVGEETLVKVSAEDSEGTLAFFHLVAPPMSGPPRHVHTREDELFYVLEGGNPVQHPKWNALAASGARWVNDPPASFTRLLASVTAR